MENLIIEILVQNWEHKVITTDDRRELRISWNSCGLQTAVMVVMVTCSSSAMSTSLLTSSCSIILSSASLGESASISITSTFVSATSFWILEFSSYFYRNEYQPMNSFIMNSTILTILVELTVPYTDIITGIKFPYT